MKGIKELFIEDRMWPGYIHENRRRVKNKVAGTDFQHPPHPPRWPSRWPPRWRAPRALGWLSGIRGLADTADTANSGISLGVRGTGHSGHWGWPENITDIRGPSHQKAPDIPQISRARSLPPEQPINDLAVSMLLTNQLFGGEFLRLSH